MMMFGGLQAPFQPQLAEQLRLALLPSIERDAFESLDEVMGELQRGEATAWIATVGPEIRMVCVTQILVGEHGAQCFIRHCAGTDRSEWINNLFLIEQWAMQQGCKSVELIGRKGWIRALAPHGYEERAVVLRKVL